ncbi:cytochrome b [Rhodobacterales bacterium HKCCE4037]|nr:cytochrome b [Rhodobacterales bacterium HKCCE4037]
MSGIPHDHYEPKSRGEKWLHRRLPIVSLLYDTLMIPTPKNLNWMWIWGIVLVFCLVMQIITGVLLVMHYTPHVDMAFASIEHIMRDVNAGWAIRYIHMNGASLFFIAVYLHIFRGLYYGSYKAPREVTWIIGMLIYVLMMGTAFLGYVLPWGQMSFWGATVITGLFGAIPFIGESIQTWLLGGPAVDNATLNRFLSLHYLLPFLILGLVIVHVWAFHTTGNNNPTGVEVRRTSKKEAEADTLPFWPYFVIKDLFALAVVLVLFFAVTGFMPNLLGHPDNYIEANPLVTPAHIVPEWYFLPFYAILRAFDQEVWVVIIADTLTGGIVDAKFFGVIAMFGAILVMALAPWLDTSSVRSGRFRPMFKWWFWLLVVDFMVLMWVGARPAEGIYPYIALIGSTYWFAYFLVILPLLGVIEKPLPQPATIEEDFNDHYGGDHGTPGSGTAASAPSPAE